MSNKTTASTLFIMAGIIILGLIFDWDYETWRVIDVAIIVTLIFLGVKYYKHNDNEFNLKILNFLKNKKFKIITITTLVVAIILCVVIYGINQGEFMIRKCNFTLSSIKENRYQEDNGVINPPTKQSGGQGYVPRFSNGYKPETHKTYWEIDGLLKNNSEKKQYLKSIITKMYTADNQKILLTEGFINVGEYLDSNQSYPFQVRAQIDRSNPTLGKYFNKDDKIILDVYPWFSDCK